MSPQTTLATRERRREFKWRRFPPVQLFLYVLVRSVLMIVGMFPYRMAPKVGNWLGRIIQLIDRKHRRIAVKNLEKSRGICPPDAITEFIDRVYGHMGLGFVEMMMIPKLIDQIERYVRHERFHVAEEVLRQGRGMIVVIGHLGNWELIGLSVPKAGYPLHSLARPIENPWIDRYLHRFRTQTGQRIISKYRALGEMIRVLQKKEILIIQVDQDARNHGVFVDFFGRPASTHRSPALLSLKYGTPVVVANIYRENGLHHCVLSDPIRPESFRAHADPVGALTQAYTEKFEECVRAHPDQWFWVHDRWKTAERAGRATSDGAPSLDPTAAGPGARSA
jgi:KDO2-lipid IV(A) lauroyltransferase